MTFSELQNALSSNPDTMFVYGGPSVPGLDAGTAVTVPHGKAASAALIYVRSGLPGAGPVKVDAADLSIA